MRLNGPSGAGSQLLSRVGAGTFVLDIDRQRAVCVALEGHPAAHRKAVDGIRDLKALVVVEGD